MRIVKNKKSTKIIIGILIALALAAGSYAAYSSISGSDTSNPTDSPQASGHIDYSPATTEDTEHTEKIKQDIVDSSEEENTPAPQNDKRKQANITITTWGQPGGASRDFVLNGYVSNVIESDGTCTLTMTKEGEKASVSKRALQNAQNTSCGQLSVPFDQLSTGKWQATLSYSSASATGNSKSIEVEVK